MLCNVSESVSARLDPFRCKGRGWCSRTGRAHLELTGKALNGQFWTLIAQPYPRPLCKKLAQMFAVSVRDSRVSA